MREMEIPFEVPWLGSYSEKLAAVGLHDKAGYTAWLKQELRDGQRAMVIVLPLVVDTPAYHAAAFRYYWSTVLPIAAEDLGEPNLEQAHDVLAKQFLLKKVVARKGGMKVKRQSTSMESMLGPHFCEYLDRLIVWLTTDRGLVIPMADPAWKWKQGAAS